MYRRGEGVSHVAVVDTVWLVREGCEKDGLANEVNCVGTSGRSTSGHVASRSKLKDQSIGPELLPMCETMSCRRGAGPSQEKVAAKPSASSLVSDDEA